MELSAALLAILVSVLWGGNVVSIRLGLDTVPPLWSAFWRMLLGALFVAAWCRARGSRIWPRRGEGWPIFYLGVLFTVQIALLNCGAAYTSPAYAVVILNSYAVFSNLAGHLFARHHAGGELEHPLTRARAAGLLLALAGVSILALGQHASALAPRPLLGNGLMVISSALLGVRQVYTRWLVQKVDPPRAMVWQMLWSVPLFALMAFTFEPVLRRPLTLPVVAALGYQGIVVAGFCFVVWAQLLRRVPAGTLSMYSFLVAVSGITLSAWIFREPVGPGLILGAALVLGGVYLSIRSSGRLTPTPVRVH